MHEIQLAGTREELGRAYGEIVAERKLNTWWMEPSGQKLAFVKACEETIAEHAPGYLDEFRALADATRSDYYLVLSNMSATLSVTLRRATWWPCLAHRPRVGGRSSPEITTGWMKTSNTSRASEQR